ncbi:MAG: hypothetical protein ACR2OI_08130 [Acidimicrobiia bacterium]
MSTRSTTSHRPTTIVLGLVAAALAVLMLAGPGSAAPQGDASSCPTTCLDDGGTFGPTIPVSLDAASALDLVAVIEGHNPGPRTVTMDFISAEAGREVTVVADDGTVATIELDGRVGYVPSGWVQGS